MDAWNDCMSDRDESISIHIDNAKNMKENSPEIFNALVECSAFINYRLTERGAQPIIALSYYV